MTRLAARAYAVAGALTFVASLGYSVYMYAIRLGSAGATTGPWLLGLALNLALFGTFALHHSLLARSGVKRWLARYIPSELERATYVWIASVLYALMCFWWQAIPGSLYATSGIARTLAFGVQGGGLAVTLWAASVLDPLDLAGVRQLTAAPDQPAELRVRGPYHWVRHPIYFGWLLMVFGAPDMTFGRLSFAVISTTYIALAVPWEEASMVDTFGAQYERYRDEVRWRMMPGVY